MLTERGLRGLRYVENMKAGRIFEPGNSLLPEYSCSNWALTCAWLFASIILDMLLD